MPAWWESLLLTFVPLFIVIDAVGNLPFVLAMTGGMAPRERTRAVHVAVITAAAVGLAFLFLGQLILDILDISVGTLAVAGGLILFTLSIRFMLTGRVVEESTTDMIPVVPIGTPLLAGPATITTLLLLAAIAVSMVVRGPQLLGIIDAPS